AKVVDIANFLHVLAVDQHLTLDPRRAHQIDRAVDALEQGSLARVGWTDDPEDLPGRNLERDVAQRNLRAVRHRGIFEFDAGHQGLTYHFFRERRYARKAMDMLLTASTRPISTTAVPYWSC